MRCETNKQTNTQKTNKTKIVRHASLAKDNNENGTYYMQIQIENK